MKSITVFFISIIVFCHASFAQADTANLRRQATICVNATLKHDYKTLLKYTDPNVIKKAGGADKMEQALKATMTAMESRQMTMVADKLGAITGPVKAGKEIHALIQHTMTLKFMDKYMRGVSYMLAVSRDNGKNWTFADVAGLRNPGPQSIFPNYNPALKIPAAAPPQIVDKP